MGGDLEGRARDLAEAIPDGLLIVDAAGIIRFANSRLAEMTGHTQPELLGRPAEMLMPASHRAAHRRHRAGFWEAAETRPMGGGLEAWCLRRDGTRFPVDVTLSPLPSSGESVVLATVRDVTRRKRALEIEHEYRLLVEAVDDYAIFMLDPEGRVRTWNRGAERLKGYRGEEIVGRHFSAFYPPEQVAAGKPAALLRRTAEMGRAEDEGVRVRKDGSRFLAGVVLTALTSREGKLEGFLEITRDESERERTRDALERVHVLEERERIARALYERVIHSVFAVGLRLQNVAQAEDADVVRHGVEQAVADLDRVIHDVRSLVFDLRAPPEAQGPEDGPASPDAPPPHPIRSGAEAAGETGETLSDERG